MLKPTKTNIKLKLDNLMKFIRESELKMKTVRSARTNLNEQYQVTLNYIFFTEISKL